MQSRFALSGRQHEELQRHLFPGDGLEAVALVLCGRGRGTTREQLVAHHVVPIPHSQTLRRRDDHVEWSVEDFLLPLVEEMEDRDLGLVVVHCHPKGGRFFSRADDDGDRLLFPSVHSWFDRPGIHGAAVMLPNGEILGRTVGADGEFRPFDVISVGGHDIQLFLPPTEVPLTPEHAIRVAQTFGTATLQRLQRLRVAVVGCSGTGSIIIELLARNCIGTLVLVDGDRVEKKNLNRIINSTAAHAEAKEMKAEALATAVRAFGLGTAVEVHTTSIMSESAARAVASCDVAFGCVDTLEGRHTLNELCSAYSIPLFDVGVDIQPDGEGGISHATADAHYIQPHGSSLLSRGVYTPAELTAEGFKRTNPDYYDNQRKAGYLRSVDEDRPAVMPLNMVASNGAVIDLLARLHRFRLDPNADFAGQRWSLTHGYHECTPEGEPCAYMARLVGFADAWRPKC